MVKIPIFNKGNILTIILMLSNNIFCPTDNKYYTIVLICVMEGVHIEGTNKYSSMFRSCDSNTFIIRLWIES